MVTLWRKRISVEDSCKVCWDLCQRMCAEPQVAKVVCDYDRLLIADGYA